MDKLYAVFYNMVMGGWWKGKRTEVLGYATLLGTLAYMVVEWTVGDKTLIQVLEWAKDNWEQIALGYGMVFVGERMKAVKDVAEKAALMSSNSVLKMNTLLSKKD